MAACSHLDARGREEGGKGRYIQKKERRRRERPRMAKPPSISTVSIRLARG